MLILWCNVYNGLWWKVVIGEKWVGRKMVIGILSAFDFSVKWNKEEGSEKGIKNSVELEDMKGVCENVSTVNKVNNSENHVHNTAKDKVNLDNIVDGKEVDKNGQDTRVASGVNGDVNGRDVNETRAEVLTNVSDNNSAVDNNTVNEKSFANVVSKNEKYMCNKLDYVQTEKIDNGEETCKVRVRTNEEIEKEQNKKKSEMVQEKQVNQPVKKVNTATLNKENDGFVEARGRRNYGRSKYVQPNRQAFRPKEAQNNGNNLGNEKVNEQNNGGEGTSKTPPSLEKVWRVSPETVKEIHRSANKFAVLDNDGAIENVDQKSKEIVDNYVLRKVKPNAAESQQWTYEMFLYFRQRWKTVNIEIGISDDEEDIVTDKNENECLLADEIEGKDAQYIADKQVKNNFGWAVDKLILAASVYFIWQERNRRLFTGVSRNVESVINCIKDSVKTRLLALKVKKSNKSQRIASKWGLKWSSNDMFEAC
ncbi:hypothetical protein CTI12_AA036050 [Artemisia annua]|uniref:RNA-directed DNA polymerase, eukaryota, Reverse transcriptase zinc-binding domain protein n=1 Tax=Artemisia annua TaxID=35608 RepID=A0A2U1QFR1_ARTAN|nr:hypothetical protein CTI12_AA036050 [Artemisia annua]